MPVTINCQLESV